MTRFRLHLSASGLANMDGLGGKSDPKAYVELDDMGRRVQLGETECIKNTHKPQWTEEIYFDYVLGDTRELVVRVVDVDAKKGREQPLGEARFRMSTLANGDIEAKLSKKGVLMITAVPVQDNNEQLYMQFAGEGISKPGLGRPDPMLTLEYRVINDQGSSKTVRFHATQPVKNNKNPDWAAFKMKSSEFCNCDENLPVVAKVYDWEKDGDHEYLGEFKTTLAELKAGKRAWTVQEVKKNGKPGKERGVVRLTAFRAEKVARLADFKGKLEIRAVYHLDFTGSNGPAGLHQGKTTPYSEGVQRIHEVLGEYDPRFEFHGFGGIFEGEEVTSHDTEFTKPDGSNEFTYEEFLERYRQVVRTCTLNGPTYFSTILRNVLKQVHTIPRNRFDVHVIFTDGALSGQREVDQVKRLLREMGRYRVFFIIVGIGAGETARGPDGRPLGFSVMRDLDDPDPEEKAADIVDKTDFVAADECLTAAAFRAATMAELPAAIEQAMHRDGIHPADLPPLYAGPRQI